MKLMILPAILLILIIVGAGFIVGFEIGKNSYSSEILDYYETYKTGYYAVFKITDYEIDTVYVCFDNEEWIPFVPPDSIKYFKDYSWITGTKTIRIYKESR